MRRKDPAGFELRSLKKGDGVYKEGENGRIINSLLSPASVLACPSSPSRFSIRFRRFAKVPRCTVTTRIHHHVYKSIRWVSFVELAGGVLAVRTARLMPRFRVPV